MNPRLGSQVIIGLSLFLSPKCSVANTVVRAQLTFQMLISPNKISIHVEPVFQTSILHKTRDRKCLVPLAQMIRAFGINPVGRSRHVLSHRILKTHPITALLSNYTGPLSDSDNY